MKRSLLFLLGLLAVPFLVVACGGQGGGSELDDSREAEAFRYRHGVMLAIEWKVAELRSMVDGEIPVDEAQFKESANELLALSGMITEGFIPDSLVAGSLALPDVWTKWVLFVAEAEEFEAGVKNFADAAAAGGFAGAKDLIQGVGQSCGGCHRPYRRRAQ
jgi:cytochrome c556